MTAYIYYLLLLAPSILVGVMTVRAYLADRRHDARVREQQALRYAERVFTDGLHAAEEEWARDREHFGRLLQSAAKWDGPDREERLK
jgi:hypothetical protein